MGSGGGKGKSAQTEIPFYYMSMHIGICAFSEGLEFLGIKFGDKYAYRSALPSPTGGRAVIIHDPNLFGGNKKEGGVEGKLWWLDGNPDQIVPEALAQKLGRTSATCPGFRGFASLFLTEPDTISVANPAAPANTANPFGRLGSLDTARPGSGFLMAANNPYLKDISVRVRRPSIGLNPNIALIRVQDDSYGNEQYASNPAHIIYECMTNTDWGLGEDPAAFDIAQWNASAQTLYNEDFGLCLKWMRQSSIEVFLKEPLDHIQGKIDINPQTGLYELRLLRGDYDTNYLPELNESNAVFSNFKMKSWATVINEVVVSYTNPETSKKETVTAQDPAAISLQGGITSDTRDYYGIVNPDLALRVAERDLGISAHPVPNMTAEVTLKFWLTKMSDVFKVNWPKRGIQQGFYRVSKVTRGRKGRTVLIELYEDVFALDKAVYLTSTASQWTNTSQAPSPLIYYKVGTAPAFFTVSALGLSDISQLEYPECLGAVIAARDSSDDLAYELFGSSTSVTGSPIDITFGEQPLRTSWLLAGPLISQAISDLTIPNRFLGSRPNVGDFILIGNGPDTQNEFAVILSITGPTMQVSRGVLDTVPMNWATGSRVWIIPARTISGDPTRRSAFETATYRLLTMTSRGKLPFEAAPAIDVTLSERPHLPLRPANVKVDGVGFGSISISTSASPTVTWANRNRIVEASQIFQWTEASTAGETGQTTRIYIMNSATRNVVTTISNIAGISRVLTPADFAGLTSAIVRVVSVRDGMESLQGHEILVLRS